MTDPVTPAAIAQLARASTTTLQEAADLIQSYAEAYASGEVIKAIEERHRVHYGDHRGAADEAAVMTMHPDHFQFRRPDPSAERKAPAGDGRPNKLPGPKPVQAYCRLCERLFAYFQTTKRRQYCGPCVEIERRAALVFSNERQRRDRLAARENAMLCHGVEHA